MSANIPPHHEQWLIESSGPSWNLRRRTLMNPESSVFPGIWRLVTSLVTWPLPLFFARNILIQRKLLWNRCFLQKCFPQSCQRISSITQGKQKVVRVQVMSVFSLRTGRTMESTHFFFCLSKNQSNWTLCFCK